jgi:hypothetical protein
MKKIILIILVLSANYVFAQDSLNYVLNGNKFIQRIKPIIGFGVKNQSVLKSYGLGPYLNVGLSYNNSIKLVYGREYTSLNYSYLDANGSNGYLLDGYTVVQNNLGLSYISRNYKVLHAAFNLNFTNSKYFPPNLGEYVRFKGIKPGIEIQLNLNKISRFTIGVARNITYKRPETLYGLQLNGNEFSFGFEFSRFKK